MPSYTLTFMLGLDHDLHRPEPGEDDVTYQPERSIYIGDFFIAPGIQEGRVWIGRALNGLDDGEGGDFDPSELSEVIGKFYDERF